MFKQPKSTPITWTTPEGSLITFEPGTTAEQVQEFIVAYGKSAADKQPRIDRIKFLRSR